MIEPLNSSLYETVCSWWEYYKTPKYPNPPERSYVASVGGIPVCFAICFVDDTKLVAWIAYVTMNPKAAPAERSVAFAELMKHIEESLREEGVKTLFASANNPSLVARHVKNEYQIADLDVVHMTKQL